MFHCNEMLSWWLPGCNDVDNTDDCCVADVDTVAVIIDEDDNATLQNRYTYFEERMLFVQTHKHN